MRKISSKLFAMIMTAAVSVSMIIPQVNVSASQHGLTAQKIKEQSLPDLKQSDIKQSAKKTEPEEWNQTSINVYKFGKSEDVVYYLLTSGSKYYNTTYFKNPQKIKLTAVESGTLYVALSSDKEQAGTIYDANQKVIKKFEDNYVKAQVNAGDVYYVDFPKNSKEGIISAYILKNQYSKLSQDDLNVQKGEGKETYHSFKMKKRGSVDLMVRTVIEDGGNITYKVQKSTKGKWTTIGKKRTIKSEDFDFGSYGLSAGNYRLVLKAPKEQVSNTIFEKKYYSKKKIAYKKSKAYKIGAQNVYTTGEKAPRWYKVTVKSTKEQERLQIATDVNVGGFKFEIYQNGKKKPIKTIKTSKRNFEKRVKLPKKKGTYYIKVSKLTKKTNGYYEIFNI